MLFASIPPVAASCSSRWSKRSLWRKCFHRPSDAQSVCSTHYAPPKAEQQTRSSCTGKDCNNAQVPHMKNSIHQVGTYKNILHRCIYCGLLCCGIAGNCSTPPTVVCHYPSCPHHGCDDCFTPYLPLVNSGAYARGCLQNASSARNAPFSDRASALLFLPRVHIPRHWGRQLKWGSGWQ